MERDTPHTRQDQVKRWQARNGIAAADPVLGKSCQSTFPVLDIPVYDLYGRNKFGRYRTLCMFAMTAAVVLARATPSDPYVIMTKKTQGSQWPSNAERFACGPLHHSLAVAMEFLRKYGDVEKTNTLWAKRPASEGALDLLDSYIIEAPAFCTAGEASALITSHHFGRSFNAITGSRLWMNGRHCRRVEAGELERGA